MDASEEIWGSVSGHFGVRIEMNQSTFWLLESLFYLLSHSRPPNYITVYKIFFYSHNSESWSPFEAEAWHFSVKAHFYRLYPLFYSSGHYPHLLVMGEDRNVDWPMNRKLTFTLGSLLTTTKCSSPPPLIYRTPTFSYSASQGFILVHRSVF